MPTGPITKKVVKLCQEIAVDPQFCECRKNVLEFIENKDQNREYFDLLDYQFQLEEKSEKGESISPDEIEKLEELGVKAFQNQAAVDFMHGQDALEQLQELVDNAISYVIEHGEAPSDKYLHELDEN
jgi:cell fate (sporulation/competence/biofilm development) regulator YlbF (YheA/YmcA/DUF963 family)